MLARTKVISQFLQDRINHKIDLVLLTSNLMQPFELHLSDSDIIEMSEIPSLGNTSKSHLTVGYIDQILILVVPIDITNNQDNIPLWDGICSIYKEEILFMDRNTKEGCTQSHLLKIKELISSNATAIPFRGLDAPLVKEAFIEGNIPIKEALLTDHTQLNINPKDYLTITTNTMVLLNSILWKHKQLGCYILEIPQNRISQITDFCKYILTCIASYMKVIK